MTIRVHDGGTNSEGIRKIWFWVMFEFCISGNLLQSLFPLYIFRGQIYLTEWVVYNICTFFTFRSRRTFAFTARHGSDKQDKGDKFEMSLHVVLWQALLILQYFSLVTILWSKQVILQMYIMNFRGKNGRAYFIFSYLLVFIMQALGWGVKEVWLVTKGKMEKI